MTVPLFPSSCKQEAAVHICQGYDLGALLATNLIDVVFRCQLPRPHLGLENRHVLVDTAARSGVVGDAILKSIYACVIAGAVAAFGGVPEREALLV